jgi:ribosomal protein S27AE
MTRRKRTREDDDKRDDRPPICPNCGVTQGIVVTDGDDTKFVCLECGFSDDESSGD